MNMNDNLMIAIAEAEKKTSAFAKEHDITNMDAFSFLLAKIIVEKCATVAAQHVEGFEGTSFCVEHVICEEFGFNKSS